MYEAVGGYVSSRNLQVGDIPIPNTPAPTLGLVMDGVIQANIRVTALLNEMSNTEACIRGRLYGTQNSGVENKAATPKVEGLHENVSLLHDQISKAERLLIGIRDLL